MAGGPGQDWRLDYLFTIGSTSWFIHVAVTVLSAIVLFQAGGGAWVPIWLISILVPTIGMIVLAFTYLRRRPVRSPQRYSDIHACLTTLIGIVWGGGALACAHLGPQDMLAFYSLVLGGTALGAVSSQHAVRRNCLLSVWTGIPPLALAWATDGTNLGPLATALMMLLFGLALTILAIRMGGFLESNVQLAEALADQNAKLTRTSERLREAHAEKSRFLAQASHDLRQPIHAIGLFVEYLGGMRLGQDSRAVLSNIDRSLESLNRLCRSLLDLSALDVGRVRPNIGPVALGEIMGDVARQAQQAAQAAGMRVRFRPSRAWVESDPALLHTIVQNLVSNAIKYAPGADILIGVRRHNGRYAIVVADNGPGIDPADHERIFGEFVQIRNPETPQTDGLGLGLSIVKRLTELLGLTITLKSSRGAGSSFRVDGLVAASPQPVATRRSPMRHTDRLHGLKVLVVDDDKLVRTGTVQLLSRWGCDARATERVGAEFDIPEVILCDYDLGNEENGFGVIARIRERAGHPVAAAIITGSVTENFAHICRQDGIALLTKPVRPAQLRSVLLASLSAQTSPSSEAIPAAADRVGTSSALSNAET